MKQRLSALSDSLSSMTGQIPSYDLEKYTARLCLLLKKASNQEPKKRFQFKRKPVIGEPRPSFAGDVLDKDKGSPPDSTQITDGQTLTLDPSKGLYRDLRRCTLKYSLQEQEASTSLIESSALSLRSLTDCTIDFHGCPFKQGSIHIENATNSTILIRLQTDCNIQVRLYGLVACKIYIVREDPEPQTIILENCSKCQFHSKMKNLVDIQDFSNIGKCLSQDQDYLDFGTFDTT